MFSLKKGLFDFILAGVLVMLLQENREMKERREKELRAANDNDRIDHFNLQITELKEELKHVHAENRMVKRVSETNNTEHFRVRECLTNDIEELMLGLAESHRENEKLKNDVDDWRKKYADERERTLQLEADNEKLKNEWVEKTAKADGYV